MKKISLACLLLGSAALASAGEFTVSSGVDYSSGKYGQTTATDITAVPFVGKYTTGAFTLKASVAYLSIHGPSNFVGTGDSVTVNTSVVSSSTKTVNGWGDWILAGSYAVVEKDGLLVNLTGKAKLATASVSQGLSTGENDYSVLADIYKTVDKTTFYGGGGYKWVGVPTGSNYRNVWQGTVGLSQKISQSLTAGLSYDYAQSIVPGKLAREEVTVYAVKKLNDSLKVQFYGLVGLNNNSASYGGGALLSYLF